MPHHFCWSISWVVLILFAVSLDAQSKFEIEYEESTYNSEKESISLDVEGLYTSEKSSRSIPTSKTYFQLSRQFKNSTRLGQPTLITKNVRGEGSLWMEVHPSSRVRNLKSLEGQLYTLLDEISEELPIDNPRKELEVVSSSTDAFGHDHIKLQQLHRGTPVYGAELIAHRHHGQFDLINGQPKNVEIAHITPSITSDQAIEISMRAANATDLPSRLLKYTGGSQGRADLIIYIDRNETARLTYHVSLYPDIAQRWSYFIDAITSEVIHSHSSSCKFHHHHETYNEDISDTGPESAIEPDLRGNNVRINVYEEDGIYYLLNVNESMFNAAISDLPNEPVGGILTLNAKNTSPQTDNFSVDHIATTTNVWQAPVAVTAHANATKSYRYFEDNFGRQSYDARGGTIFSFINVADEDGSGMDNAFWNGFALFYGNGKEAFSSPLAAAEDVAAHELAHGVVQHTANLTYENESGALNESFADIFGVLIDRDDWTIGEEVVNTRIFRSGALRSMSDPNNGGTRLGDPGWQPKSVAEQFRGREDNGGVHINSGIPNHAFYLFATDTRVGRDRAEVVFYKALTDYLSSSSNFTDLRRAVRQSIVDIFGNNEGILDAFTSAFDQVGIEGDGTTTAPEPEITTFEVNPGEEFVLWYRRRTEQFVLRTVINEIDAVISTRGLSNIPSVSDDGRIIVFIGSDRNMYAILIDPDTGALSERLISNSREWRNVAISKDGTKIAAVSGNLSNGEFDNRILIVDLISETQQWYELSNPTTAEGISTGDVRFADALVWDHTSQFVMYDAANEISSLFGDPISYWDIGFLRAWDAQNDTYGDGSIAKLFPSLPENVSVGNPTFTHASPDIIAMDLLDSRSGETEYSIIGVNLETSDQGLLFENNTVGYPRYSTRDDAMLFNFQRTTDEIVGILETNADRISSPGEGFLYAEDGRWGVWFSNGQRDLTTSVNEIISDDRLKIFPNPAGDHIQVSIESHTCSDCAIRIYNTEGQLQLDQVIDEDNIIDVRGLSGGIYTLLLRSEDGLYSQKFIKW